MMKEKIYQTIKATLKRCNPNANLMQFGRKAPTAAELTTQWQEQQRHEAEIRQRFITAERETDARTGYFHVCKDNEDPHQESNESEVFEYEGEFIPIMLNPEMMIEVKEKNPIESGKPMCSSSAWIK